ncbi:MAG: hypothetical protein CMF25_07395 [Kangiellaceae bacterium]|jgi:uncharacterized protein YjfI (DUF2170 family)|nr:hypothetical protein [Kangiellaceae bacterium]|tara:strand:+ start:245 stop:652 length:408 start_codon:yes stop_codon:yes gene_type:complete
MNCIKELTLKLAEANYQGHRFNCLPIEGEQPVLRVEVSELDDLPIFVTASETQLLCIVYLFKDSEVAEGRHDELNQYLLELNVPMPLSSFAKIDEYYVVFGSMATDSTLENVMLELVTLAQNANSALPALEEFIS